jgi:predicted lipid-binding transport protein (Tim44 family)
MSVSPRAATGIVFGLAVGLAALVLAGCGGGGSATSVGPAGESSGAASVSPEPSTPEPSAAASPAGDSRADVEQAVRAYVDAANVAMATGDTAALRALSTPECSCLRLAESIEELYGSGGRAEGARWDLEDLTVVDVTGASASVRVALSGQAYATTGVTSGESFPATSVRQLISLTQASGWRVSSVDELSRA